MTTAHGLSSFQDALDRLDAALDEPSPSLVEIASADLEALQSRLTEGVVEMSKEKITQLTDSAEIVKALGREGVAFLATNGPRLAQDLADQGAELVRAIDKEVRARPWLFIGGAAAAALALGVIVVASQTREREQRPNEGASV